MGIRLAPQVGFEPAPSWLTQGDRKGPMARAGSRRLTAASEAPNKRPALPPGGCCDGEGTPVETGRPRPPRRPTVAARVACRPTAPEPRKRRDGSFSGNRIRTLYAL